MTVYELLMFKKDDFDTYDTTYDMGVTVCYIDKERDEYDKFCNGIIKKVEVKEMMKDCIVADWTDLIKRNMEKFKKFTMRHWAFTYENDMDEFIYQWIKEIHYYVAGYVSEDFYLALNEFVNTLE